jgi:hypothetical protein
MLCGKIFHDHSKTSTLLLKATPILKMIGNLQTELKISLSLIVNNR